MITKKENNIKSLSKSIALAATMAAMLIIGKYVLSLVANIEVVTTLTVVFAYSFGAPALLSTLAFCAVDMALYQFSPSVAVSYFVYWNLLCLLAILMKRSGVKSDVWYIIFALVMTLLFGFLTSFVDFLFYSIDFWAVYLSGLIFYALQLASTLVFMLTAFRPLVNILEKTQRRR